jgi:hypothetical protein
MKRLVSTIDDRSQFTLFLKFEFHCFTPFALSGNHDRFAPGIISNPDISGLDSSANVSNFTSFVFNESHYQLRFL